MEKINEREFIFVQEIMDHSKDRYCSMNDVVEYNVIYRIKEK